MGRCLLFCASSIIIATTQPTAAPIIAPTAPAQLNGGTTSHFSNGDDTTGGQVARPRAKAEAFVKSEALIAHERLNLI